MIWTVTMNGGKLMCIRIYLTYRFILLGMLEYAWNKYPSTTLSSKLMLASHLVILNGLALSDRVASSSRARAKVK